MLMIKWMKLIKGIIFCEFIDSLKRKHNMIY